MRVALGRDAEPEGYWRVVLKEGTAQNSALMGVRGRSPVALAAEPAGCRRSDDLVVWLERLCCRVCVCQQDASWAVSHF